MRGRGERSERTRTSRASTDVRVTSESKGQVRRGERSERASIRARERARGIE